MGPVTPMPQMQGIHSRIKREGPQKVFVYGTLKKGYGNHQYYLQHAKDLGPATTTGIMFNLGAFPAISLAEPFGPIHGEVYEVNWDEIAAMDRLEGINNGFYIRIEAKVAPQGIAWMYCFTHDRASREKYVVPSGIWKGVDTPQVKWLGFGKGVEIGSFQTNLAEEEIKVGPGKGGYVLRPSPMDSSYKLVNTKSGEIMGSYKHVRDIVRSDGTRKPVLSLPAVSTAVKSQLQVDGSVVSVIPPHHQHPNIPIIWTPSGSGTSCETPEPKEESIPQAARLLGLKYGEA